MSVIELRRANLLCNNCKEHRIIPLKDNEQLFTDDILFWQGDLTPECKGCMSRDYVVVWAD